MHYICADLRGLDKFQFSSGLLALKSAQFVCIKCRARQSERETARDAERESEHTAFDCVKLYVMPPTASAPGTVLNRPSCPTSSPYPYPLAALESQTDSHADSLSDSYTAIHPWPARSFPCTVQRRVSLDICRRRGRASVGSSRMRGRGGVVHF